MHVPRQDAAPVEAHLTQQHGSDLPFSIGCPAAGADQVLAEVFRAERESAVMATDVTGSRDMDGQARTQNRTFIRPLRSGQGKIEGERFDRIGVCGEIAVDRFEGGGIDGWSLTCRGHRGNGPSCQGERSSTSQMVWEVLDHGTCWMDMAMNA